MNEMIRDSSVAEHLYCKQGVARSIRAPGTILLSGHQPVYLPSIHLFNKIALSDEFMFCGHCQLQTKSWHTRNYIRQGDDKIMLSVPVEKSFGQSINQTKIMGGNWCDKHVKSIEQSYRKSPYFDAYFPGLYQLITWTDWESLGEMNIAIIETIIEWLHIETPSCFSTDYEVHGHKTDMLISMCQCTGAKEYLSNEGSRDYVDESKMLDAGFKHRWQVFEHPVYEQGHKEFIPNLSVIDLLFNCGPQAGEIVRSAGYVS